MPIPRRTLLVSSPSMVLGPVLVALAAGCSGSGGPGMSANEPLPPVDVGTALPVDEGRVAVATPKGWIRASRSNDYLVLYQRAVKKPYPAVTVTVSDPPDGIASVGQDGHAAFVEAMTAKLTERFTKDGKSLLTRGPTPVVLGEHHGIAWAAPGRTKNGNATEAIDRLSYAVVMNGRLYTVEARGLRGKLDGEGILAAKAVASALAVPKPAAPVEPSEPVAPADPAVPTDTKQPATDSPAAESKDTPPPEPKPDAASPSADVKPAVEEKPVKGE